MDNGLTELPKESRPIIEDDKDDKIVGFIGRSDTEVLEETNRNEIEYLKGTIAFHAKVLDRLAHRIEELETKIEDIRSFLVI